MKQRARQGKVSGRAIKRDLKRKQQQCKRSVKKENKRERGPDNPGAIQVRNLLYRIPARACDPSLDADLSSLSAKMRGLVQPVLDAKTAIQAKDDEIEKADRQADTLKQELREIFKTTRKAEATKREEEKTLKNLVKECERTFRKENAKIQRKKTRGKKSASSSTTPSCAPGFPSHRRPRRLRLSPLSALESHRRPMSPPPPPSSPLPSSPPPPPSSPPSPEPVSSRGAGVSRETTREPNSSSRDRVYITHQDKKYSPHLILLTVLTVLARSRARASLRAAASRRPETEDTCPPFVASSPVSPRPRSRARRPPTRCLPSRTPARRRAFRHRGRVRRPSPTIGGRRDIRPYRRRRHARCAQGLRRSNKIPRSRHHGVVLREQPAGARGAGGTRGGDACWWSTAAGSARCALLGDNLAEMAMRNGWSGVVVNGCVRDSEDVRRMDVGVKAIGTHPLKSSKRDWGRRDVEVRFAG